ncbi:ABC transporter ATP-binding protein [Aureimonas psammosilenae]|uniref:ABC transporter ATP-binding protein n=1 Tax=Aureimonas psammosilenae TaxID=2495496 RepID=UPI0018696E39|nr:ATP-binding cassette domain-containing protein [Aureimonas psammosilenae]
MARLVVRDLMKRLKDRERSFELRIPAFDLAPGDRKAIVGATGSGKTTAMDVLALASRPDRFADFAIENTNGGRLALTGSERDLARFRARHFGYVVQTSPLFPFLTLAGNVRLQQRLAGRRDEALIRHLIDCLGLSREADARPDGLSVGQRQRAAVARALAHRPSFLLCDEPTGALDGETAELCLGVMDRVAKESGTAILMITHDPELAQAHGYVLLPIERQATGRQASVATLCDGSSTRREAA